VSDDIEKRQLSLALVLRLLLGAMVLGAVLVGIGLVLTHLGSWSRTDGGPDRWFAGHRSTGWNDATAVGSNLAQTQTAVAVAFVAFFALRLWLGRWYESLVLVLALGGEVVIFLAVAAIVHRPRPPVARLDAAPPTSSFPSGHTAAAVVVYGFLAFVLWRYLVNRWLAAVLCTVLLAVPFAVGLSRLYRGAHYPSDVVAGAILGAVWLTFVIVTMFPDRSNPPLHARQQGQHPRRGHGEPGDRGHDAMSRTR